VKRVLLLALAIGTIVLLLIWGLRPATHYINFPPRANGPWIAFGDSLTEGYGASEGSNYPALLSRKLGVEIRNSGRSGETSADGLARIEQVAALHPRVVLLCFGGNDSLSGEPVSRTIRHLAQMIDRLHGEGSFVVLIGIRSASPRDKNEPHFRKLARDRNVLYVADMLEGLAFKPIYMSDAIHPNDAGYARIAERLEKALKPLLPKLIGSDGPRSEQLRDFIADVGVPDQRFAHENRRGPARAESLHIGASVNAALRDKQWER
jgi:lysophospholipase L1-like esterase